METGDFLQIFLTESREHLEGMNATLTRSRGGALEQDGINELFRHAHSLKGMASTMGFHPLTGLAHAMEDVFQRWRAGSLAPSAPMVERLLLAADRLAGQLDAIEAGKDPEDDPAMVDSLRSILDRSGDGAPPADGSPAAGDAGDESPPPPSGSGSGEAAAASGPGEENDARPRLLVEVRLGTATALPAARGRLILRELESFGRVLICNPPPEEVVPGRFGGQLRIMLASSIPAATIADAIRAIPDVELCRVGIGSSDDRRQTDRRGSTDRRRQPGPAGIARPEAAHTIRVATDRMDRLLDGVGELILDRERLKIAVRSEPGAPEIGILEGLGRTIEALRDEVMAMRLTPFSSITPRLERTVRDLCHRLDKKVDLVVAGGDVSVDRSILEELMDPLQHILRNGIDHGVESPETRSAAGKNEVGRIEIGLSRHEERIALTVEDDGGGIDPIALRRVAVERRFINREAAESLSDDEVLQLITTPGFSTAHRTTEISGRGVGMDVVQTQVRKLGGRLHIRSRVGHGTRVEMDLPLTLTVTRAFLCRAAEEVYAVPVSIVQQTLEMESGRIQGSRGEKLMQRGEEIVTVLPLAGLLSDDPGAAFPAAFPALIYRIGQKTYALAVDEILGEEEIVIKPLKHPLELLPHYSGAAILNDGRIALILDPTNLAHASRAA